MRIFLWCRTTACFINNLFITIYFILSSFSVKEEIHFNSDEVLNGRKVYLISDQKDGSVRDAKCAAYKTNPRSSIIVTLVDNIVSSGACTVSFASSMSGSTNINCAKTEIVNGCNNVLYSSNTSRVDINLTMTVIADGSDRQFLWMVVTGRHD